MSLAPRPHEALAAALRSPGWRRVALARRVAAAALAVTALVLALAPAALPPGVPVTVAARDLDAGATLAPADLREVVYPADLVPAGVLSGAAGRVLAGPLRSGEPLTDARVTGSELTARLSGDPDAATVPVRLADAAVAALLRSGDRVDVVTAGPETDGSVLAGDAAVLTVLPPDQTGNGRLVLVALPRSLATRVAAASLSDAITVTLR